MLEMPEAAAIARQMNATLTGKTFTSFEAGPTVLKFLFIKPELPAMQAGLVGRAITGARSYGRSIYLDLAGGGAYAVQEMGGRLIYHAPGAALPKKYHYAWGFDDGSHMTLMTQMWGFLHLLEPSDLRDTPFGRLSTKEPGIPPLSAAFTLAAFNALLDDYAARDKRPIKAFLVTSTYINAMGNSYCQDVLYRAGILPTRKVPTLQPAERKALYNAIQDVMKEAVEKGGRVDERDFFNQPGGYPHPLCAETAGKPCPICGTAIVKISLLGGSAYFCPVCQS
jgi:formamidopyrimidine-DNA glycosylase